MKAWFKIVLGKIDWFITELVATLSNKPSFLSSKRLERLTMFALGMSIIIGYVKRHWYDMTVEQVLMLFGALVVNSAWNTVQIRKDQKTNSVDKPKEEIAQ